MSNDTSNPDIDVLPPPEVDQQGEISVDGGYGWVVVVSMLLITAHTWGINGAFGVYLAYYLDVKKYPNATELDYAFIGGLSISQITFVGPVVTKFGRKFGMRPTLLTGAILQAGALISASFATQVWHLYLSQGMLFGWACGFQYIGAAGIVPQWFTKRRGLANGIASAGSGVGGLIWSLATGAMIENLGLSWSLRITAIVAFTVNVICALLMKSRNHHIKPNQKAFDIVLLKNYCFALLLIWGFFSMMGYTILVFSLPDYGQKRLGLSLRQGAILGAMVNLGMTLGRPIVGYYSDGLGSLNMAGGATLFGSLVCFFIWTFADSYGVLILAAILGGAVCGTFWATIAPLTSEFIGLKELPSGLSIVWTSVAVPCLFAEPIALSLERSSRSSSVSVQVYTGAMFLGGTLCMLFLRMDKVSKVRIISSGPSVKLSDISLIEIPVLKKRQTLRELFLQGLEDIFKPGIY